jgi:hypothetical protein
VQRVLCEASKIEMNCLLDWDFSSPAVEVDPDDRLLREAPAGYLTDLIEAARRH